MKIVFGLRKALSRKSVVGGCICIPYNVLSKFGVTAS